MGNAGMAQEEVANESEQFGDIIQIQELVESYLLLSSSKIQNPPRYLILVI